MTPSWNTDKRENNLVCEAPTLLEDITVRFAATWIALSTPRLWKLQL